MERSGVHPATKFVYQEGQGTYDALLWVFHTLQSALESWQVALIVQIDISKAFDLVNHEGIFISSASVDWSFCVDRIDTVSLTSITACYGGWLAE